MASSAVPSPSLSTRDRLILAATEILRTRGAGEVTTQRLADSVGIVQSGVYRHFRGGPECLVAAAADAVERIRRLVEEDRILQGLAQGTEGLEDHLDLILREANEHWPIFDLVIRFRQEDSELGRTLQSGYDLLHQDLVRHFQQMEKNLPIPSLPKASRARMAATVLGMILTVCENLNNETAPRIRESAVQELALMIQGACREVYLSHA
jgi:AcrR family transcriptional regulator